MPNKVLELQDATLRLAPLNDFESAGACVAFSTALPEALEATIGLRPGGSGLPDRHTATIAEFRRTYGISLSDLGELATKYDNLDPLGRNEFRHWLLSTYQRTLPMSQAAAPQAPAA